MVKIADVAREAGVSTATVSRALNSVDSVRPELAVRVKEAAEKLGYEPNRLARSLRKRSSSVWALIIADIADPFFTAVVRGVEEVAQELGYSVLLGNSEDDKDREARYLRIAEQEQVAGVILSPHSSLTSLARLDQAGIPTVLIDRPLSGGTDVVMVDSGYGAEIATSHLLDSGWKSPACITGPDDVSTALERAHGYERAMTRAGLEHKSRVIYGDYRAEAGAASAATLFAERDPPDAIFAANTSIALGVMKILVESGRLIGRDVGMVMYDDAPWASFVNPAMSVVSQPAVEVGTAAARLLSEQISGARADEGTVIQLQPQLIIRESSVSVS